MSRLSISTISNIRELLRWRWWIVAFLALTIILNETVEHRWSGEKHVDDDYMSEIVKYGIILPLVEGFVLSLVNQAASKSLDRAVREERQSIAREMHDSIGQSLSYIRLKLEYLISNNTFEVEMARELEQVQAAADEAFKLVRGTMVKLDKGDAMDFVAALNDQASALGKRAKFIVDFESEGSSFPLPLNTQLGIVYIFREALINIEKHAHAQKVHLRVDWKPVELTVSLSDNGRGFIPENVSPEGHLGIKIMKQRAEEINAHFTLVSHPSSGTKLTLQVPTPRV